MIRRLGFVDHRAHAVLGLVAVEYLDFIAVLQVHAAVPAGLHDEELDVQPEIAIRFLRHNVRRAIFPAVRGAIVTHHRRAFVHGGIHDLPFDRQGGFEARAFPISPLLVEH